MIAMLWWLGGCMDKECTRTVAQKEIIIADDAAHMGRQALVLADQNEYAKDTLVYAITDEMELAKVIQYHLDQGKYEIIYHSEQTLDLNETAQILAYLNPFDLSLNQKDTLYTNAQGQVLYQSSHLQIQCLDDHYQEACDAAKRIVKQIINEDMSDRERIRAIHDYIVEHTVYALDADQEKADRLAYQPYGVLYKGSGVCSGYSRAFMLLAQYAGIPALYVSSAEMNHGWNYVREDGQWRHIDVTWDDPLPDQGEITTTYLYMESDFFLSEGMHSLSEAELRQVEEIAALFFSH